MTVLQKVLTPTVAQALTSQGSADVGGLVTVAAESAALTSPQEIVAAHGLESWGAGEDPEFVDVLRFEMTPLTVLSRPSEVDDPRWPTLSAGFLRGDDVIPAWWLERTRCPVGTEYWRIARDGSQRALSRYLGTAYGWRDLPAYAAPVSLVGMRASWRGREFPADLAQGQVILTLQAPEVPQGWTPTWPGVSCLDVSVNECDWVGEVILRARYSGTPVRVLQSDGARARVLLLDPDPETVDRLEPDIIEPGVFELSVDTADLADHEGLRRDLPTPDGPGTLE